MPLSAKLLPMKDRIILKPGKDKALRQHHPWIFSGAVASGGENRSGELLPIYNAQGELLGSGYFNSRSSIIGRAVCFDDRPPLQAIEESIRQAIALRQQLFANSDITAYRLINGEGDNLPGLIADLYGDLLVLQIGTLGMDRLKDTLLGLLLREVKPRAIYEKSSTPSRAEEGLKERAAWLHGPAISTIEICENGLKLVVSPESGQKTGFFLDQREMRQLVRHYAKGRELLNCFSYTGAFGVAALAGGALKVTSVDTSSKALEAAAMHVSLNGFSLDQHQICEEDVFQYLRQHPIDASFVILDPPAFSKKRNDIIPACRGYKDINRLAMAKMPPGSFLLTSSCSHFVDDALFQKVVFQASVEAKRSVRILDRHHYAADHPVDICHPEAHYLKSLFLYVV